MNVSINLAQYYSNVDLAGIDHTELVLRIGAQLGAIEEVTDWTPKYKGIVVVKVVACGKHPNADKLSLCRVDDSGVTQGVERDSEGYVQVVCGANNVATGMLAAWIPPGAIVPSTFDGEQFTLDSRELRGEVSNGMLASPKELDISDEHDGILDMSDSDGDAVPKPGEPISNYYGLNDFIVDCENKMFTHRPDCFGNMGVAREIAGIFGLKYVSPEWYTTDPTVETKWSMADGSLQLDVMNEIEELVPRFTVVSMEGTTIGDSPAWMQGFLKRVGIKPISNVVDITNYVMHLTGQPLHAFDYDKLAKVSDKPGIHPRMARKGEKLTLLGDKTIELDENDIVISTDKQAVALAGVMGGMDTEVDENTKNIAIECANFDMYAIRRTSMRHGLFTDAVTRFNKGQSPLQNDRVLNYAMKLMNSYAGATQSSQVYDLCSFDLSADNLNHVEIDIDFINSRLGSDLKAGDVKVLLENVEFSVAVQGKSMQITAPFWRMDISIKEDIVEEVGRLHGYHNLPIELPARTSKPSELNATRQSKQELRELLVSAGANEVLTYSFVHGDLIRNTGTDPDETAYHLRNALSPDLQYYRTSLLPSLLAKVRSNIKAQAGSSHNEFSLFEFGKVHIKGHMDEKDKEVPKQMRRLALVVAADAKTAKNNNGAAYYRAKRFLDYITGNKLKYAELDTNEHPITSSYQIGRSAVVTIDGSHVGVVGEIRGSISKKLKLPEYCAGFELDTDILREHLSGDQYRQLSQYPESIQDMTFEVSADTNWADLYEFVSAELAVQSAENGYLHTIEPQDIFQLEESDKKRISMRVSLSHQNKTLRTEEVTKVIETISKAADDKLKAKRI
ncbi:MAG: phenylalanyl-tRNA synthetase beta chain [Candidatus Saccharimonadales bacterium]|jgi:phenylalanyl-tRNA synthetase beta chain